MSFKGFQKSIVRGKHAEELGIVAWREQRVVFRLSDDR